MSFFKRVYISVAFLMCVSADILSLNGFWMLQGPKNILTNASVPGCVYSDLQKSGIIEYPLFRSNDVAYKWIGLSNWSYFRTFNVTEDFLELQTIDLYCEGLDTVATIEVNNVVIGNTSNMFRRYVFTIGDALKVGRNVINITFTSPVLHVSKQRSEYPYEVPPEPYFNFIRKAAYSFGWDWGPSFPSVGIWKDIYIEAYKTVSVRQIKAETYSNGNEWVLHMTTYFNVVGHSKVFAQSIAIEGLNASKYEILHIKPPTLHHETSIHLDSKIVELWWPNNMGAQKLYEVKIAYFDYSGWMDVRTLYVGFREVELIQEKVDGSKGLSFYFKINGIPLFMKGSNWIPLTSFQRVDDDSQLEWLLQSAADAHMNILRVWGGGVYESERFYKLADSLGIMIWQDFMFACAYYPTNIEFLENVREEVTYQVRRLSHHPSIIIWSGNNENEAALAQNWFNVSSSMMEMYKRDYVELYVKTVGDIVFREDPSRSYVASSPSNGLESAMEGWVSQNPQDEKFGDIHFYKYAVDGWDARMYRIPRFASEFGFQSWCSSETLRTVSVPDDLQLDSEFFTHRQRHLNGNKEMKTQIELHVKFPWSGNKTKDFLTFIYMSQVDQAMCLKTQVEHYRRHQTVMLRDGRGLTMGAMYWQLNDVWQAPTWSSIEHGGKWKILHYYARLFFSPLLVSPLLQYGNIVVYFIQDPAQLKMNWDGFFMRIECFDVHSFKPGKEQTITFHQFKPVQVVYSEELGVATSRCGCSIPSDCFFTFKVYINFSPLQVSENFLFIDNHFSNVPNATVVVADVVLKDKETFKILLKTNNFAYFVCLESLGFLGKFSMNGFMMATKFQEVLFTSVNPTPDVSLFANSLKVSSLSDIFQ